MAGAQKDCSVAVLNGKAVEVVGAKGLEVVGARGVEAVGARGVEVVGARGMEVVGARVDTGWRLAVIFWGAPCFLLQKSTCLTKSGLRTSVVLQ